MTLNEKLSFTDKYLKPAVIVGGGVLFFGLLSKVIYDRQIRDDPEIYVGFPKDFEPKNVVMSSPGYGNVIDDIVFVEMLPEEAYKTFNVNDSTRAYEGNFRYAIREGSVLFGTGHGQDTRPGRVEGIVRK